MKLMNGEAIFLKYWFFFQTIVSSPSYVISPLPGYKEGISASTIAGYNLSISKYIDNEHEKQAAILVFKYLTSLEVQKTYFKTGMFVPAIFSLFKEKDLCPSDLECNVVDNLQLFGRPTNKTKNYDEYTEKFLKYAFKFIYGDKTASDTLSDIDNITRLHYISGNSSIGLFSVIIISFFIMLMLLGLILLFIEKYKPFFNIIPLEFWFITVLGSILILSAGYTEIGVIKNIKCHFRVALLSFGITFNYAPFLNKLITLFPPKNKILQQVSENRHIFFSIFLVIDLILFSLLFIETHKVEDVIVNEGKNYQKCKINSLFYRLIMVFNLIIKVLMIAIIIFFCYMECYIKEIKRDTRLIVSAIYTNILYLLVVFVIASANLSNYQLSFAIRTCLYLVTGITNYIFLFGFRILFPYLDKQKEELYTFDKCIFRFNDDRVSKSSKC